VGAIDFEAATARDFRRDVHARWFAHWLEDEGRLDFPEARMFQTGSNRWESFARWPPATAERSLYLHPGGRLTFEPPAAGQPDAFASYVSDPANPVPSQRRPVRYPEGWAEWQAEDQRVVHGRPDVLSWVSDGLTEDLAIAGAPIAHLFASTSRTDADWVVKLIDVYPEDYPADPRMGGNQLMVAGEVFRARFRKSFERPEAVPAGEAIEYRFSLRDRSHRFRKGHRIMVQVQSSWFPLIDRNPQLYVPNIFLARPGDFRKATQRVFVSARHPTHIVLPVRPGTEP